MRLNKRKSRSSCERLGPVVTALHEPKVPSVSRVEFIRSGLWIFSPHVTGSLTLALHGELLGKMCR